MFVLAIVRRQGERGGCQLPLGSRLVGRDLCVAEAGIRVDKRKSLTNRARTAGSSLNNSFFLAAKDDFASPGLSSMTLSNFVLSANVGAIIALTISS